jgi:hypothetical protein
MRSRRALIASLLKAATAGVLAVVLAGVPLVLDVCAASCETHSHDVAAPSCHHAAAPGAHLSQAPSACGQNHHVAFAATTRPTPIGRASTVAIAVVDSPDATLAMRRLSIPSIDDSPGGHRAPASEALPLRI